MDELNPILPPEFEALLDEFYTTPAPDSAFVSRLEAQLRQRQIELNATTSPKLQPRSLPPANRARSSSMHLLRSRPMLALILVILALLLLTGITYALGRLSGFIPGIGFVNNVQSVLETPVVVTKEAILTPNPALAEKTSTPQVISTLATESVNKPEATLSPSTLPVQEKSGVTITVEQVVAETGRLVIAYKITGLPADLFGPERVPTLQAFAEAHRDEPMQEQVRLPDGSPLKVISGGSCQGAGDLATSWLDCQSIYSPLPEGVNQFTLEIQRLQNALPGELPEDWVIPITLTSVSSSQPARGVQEAHLRSQVVNGISLLLLKVDPSSAQTAFQLGLEWDGQNQILDHISPITLQDDQGHSYTLSSGREGDHFSPDRPNTITFASMLTDLADNRRPLTFRLNWVVMMATDQASLRFDPGQDAKIGQIWPMNQTLHAGGFDMHFTQARLKTDQDGLPTLEFDIQASAEIQGIPLFADGSLSSGSDFDQARGVWVSSVSLPALPTKPLDLTISQIKYQINGPWEITWQP